MYDDYDSTTDTQTSMPVIRTGVLVTRASQLSSQLSHPALQLSNELSIFHFLALGLTPGSKFTKLGGGLQQVFLCHPAKFQLYGANGLRDVRYQRFSPFGIGGLTPGPTFTKRGDDLQPT